MLCCFVSAALWCNGSFQVLRFTSHSALCGVAQPSLFCSSLALAFVAPADPCLQVWPLLAWPLYPKARTALDLEVVWAFLSPSCGILVFSSAECCGAFGQCQQYLMSGEGCWRAEVPYTEGVWGWWGTSQSKYSLRLLQLDGLQLLLSVFCWRLLGSYPHLSAGVGEAWEWLEVLPRVPCRSQTLCPKGLIVLQFLRLSCIFLVWVSLWIQIHCFLLLK